ncbi:MAG: N-acetylmuramoyl-L-alanine amidase [Solirubrobacteraceae bacterium]
MALLRHRGGLGFWLVAAALGACLVGPVAPAAAYPPADYGPAWWVPASPSNYARANRPYSTRITRIVIHVTVLTYPRTLFAFQNPRSGVSAHYVVRSLDGRITQMVHNRDIAWHAGNRYYNATSIGIEHEAFTNNCGWYTDAMYRASARLVASLARRYGIPIDRAHIIGHSEVPDPFRPGRFGGAGGHTDPGVCWNWFKYMGLVRGYAGLGPRPATSSAPRVVPPRPPASAATRRLPA